MTETQFDDLLNEVLFHYHTTGETAEQADATLEATVRRVAKREHYTPNDLDVKAIAALAYEQLSYL